MDTELDVAHDWILENVNYSDGALIVHLFEKVSASMSRKATVNFNNVFLHLVVEEVQDSLWNDEFPEDLGFIKKYSIASSHLARKINFTFFPFYENSVHFRLITRDEIIHVFCNSDPTVTVTEAI